MARNLYRFYLYSVYIALLIFVAVAIGSLLNTALAFTPLRGTYGTIPSSANVVQAVVFAVVASAIAGALAGLHYWLIRRDMRNDPAAGASAIRSFFLNMTEALGIALAVPTLGFFVLNTLANTPDQNLVSGTAFAFPTLALVVLLALERRRTQPGTGAALTFQRLHLYGVQILLLIFLTISWQSVIRSLVDAFFFSNKGFFSSCNNTYYCPPTANLLLLAITIVWFVGFWLGYGWLVRKDASSLLRLILHCLSLAYGIGLVLYGLSEALEVLFLFLFHAAPVLSDVVGPGASHDFFSPLTLGILITGVYSWWLRMAARQGLIDRRVLTLTIYAIATILSAGAFFWGFGTIIYNALQTWIPAPVAPTTNDWAAALALLVAGVGYIPLSLYLRRRHSSEPATGAGPHRGFVLALCGGGILALAIGGAVALYAWVTALFGSPIANWSQVVHSGLSTGIIGAILVAIYLPIAFRERLFSGTPKQITPTTPAPDTATTPVPVAPVTIEAILDELLIGKITRDEAATRIRALDKSTTGA